MLNRHEGIGHDIVNHCVNDIFTSGASPIFFLDYIASGRLDMEQVECSVKGMADACSRVGCALIGGETAEMPGIYSRNDYDLVGFIVGVVEKPDIITGKSIKPGDLIVGVESSGLHTNGYSLARRVLGETPADLNVYYEELGCTVGDALLEPHRCYHNDLKPYLQHIKGMAHITGGGLPGNVPRVLPSGVCARFNTSSWHVPPLFELIRQRGGVEKEEMFKVFNMGIGMVVFCNREGADILTGNVAGSQVIGEVVKSGASKRVMLD